MLTANAAVHAPTTRIVVTGSECTGKTTLSQQLARQLQATWVPEYARAYSETVTRPLTAADVSPIARRQLEGEDAALGFSPTIIVQDTDLLSTVVYSRHYYGSCPDWIVAATMHRLAPLYLLCDIDIPWIGDGVRDRPHDRELIDSLFRSTLASFGATVVLVTGSGEDRLQHALDAIRGWSPVLEIRSRLEG